ncbi:MAG: TolC family protein [Syntrophobacteraceae bacterium]|jgi:outer membrane protein TolC|nr:TolC family protein [Syntrophobacteraceae bacterium]
MILWKAARLFTTSSVALALCVGILATSTVGLTAEAENMTETGKGAKLAKGMTLDECLTTAMENSHRRPASNFAVAMAEAQHRQALAGYWPQVNLKGAFMRLDEPPNFLFPASSFNVPAQSFSIPGGTMSVTIPANAFGPGFPPGNIQLPIAFPGQTINTPPQKLKIPAQDVKLMDRDSFMASVNATWLLYDGGMRKGLREQAGGGLEIARQDARRTDLEIIDSVKRLYYGAVLARQLHQVGRDTLARMEATLSLTETMYKEGSGRVMKTDYLDNKVMVESLRSAVALLDKNEEMARAALANTMGMEWRTSVKPADRELPFAPYSGDLDRLVSTAYEFSPDWATVEAGIRAAEGAVRTARSGYHPRVALTGEVHTLWNDYNAGMVTARNKHGWSVGVGVEMAVFDGFLTRNKVKETRARVDKIKEERFLLQEGIGLQIKDIFLGLSAAQKSHQATLDALKAAEENRDLNIRAYQNELVETEKVIRAQLIEALMSAQHYKTRYDHIALQSQLSLVVGTEVTKQIEKTASGAMYYELEHSSVSPDKP